MELVLHHEYIEHYLCKQVFYLNGVRKLALREFDQMVQCDGFVDFSVRTH